MNRETLLEILALARWTPSGDNTQPWRFEIVDDFQVAIHGHDTREHVVYDFQGHASHLAHGALLETLRLAATRYGLATEWAIKPDQPDTAPVYLVRFHPAGLTEDPLVPYITERAVERRAMPTTPLKDAHKEALIAAVGSSFRLQFFESLADRLAVARLLWNNAHLRLTCPEAYPVHRDVIEWNARYSKDRIPDQALGVDALTTRLMRWVMQSWKRVDFFNRHLGGTYLPRLQMDLIPGVACAAHLLLKPKRKPVHLEDYVRTGMAIQHLWLTASRLGLHLQPEMTPVIFRWYSQSGTDISATPAIDEGARKLAGQFDRLAQAAPDDAFAFLCRVGYCPPPAARSLRRDINSLDRGQSLMLDR
ncbi:nitroreductase family protein [Propionivibrio limicola]|uniref:nitroreductase family protein n=1 Tax=Propionivibrio limicola TaxID=167645 RepID=UPI00129280F9|nr:nitroreductase family protein [Propionivibrio limicola]